MCGIVAISGRALAMRTGAAPGEVRAEPVPLTAIPYYAWQHRGPGEMTVWIPESIGLVDVAPSASAP